MHLSKGKKRQCNFIFPLEIDIMQYCFLLFFCINYNNLKYEHKSSIFTLFYLTHLYIFRIKYENAGAIFIL
jgi:hypothetical protein